MRTGSWRLLAPAGLIGAAALLTAAHGDRTPGVTSILAADRRGGLNAAATSDPAAVSWGPGRIDLFVRGADNALWHKWYDGKWHTWESLGGTLSSGPDVSSWGSGRLDVFVRGSDNATYHRSFHNGWSNWNRLAPEPIASDPSAVSWGSGRIDLFVRGTDNALHRKWYDGSWAPAWEFLGGALTSGPEASSWGAGRLDVFARGTDYALHHKWFEGRWSEWESLGGAITADPAAVSWGSGRIDLFVRGTDNAVWHKWYQNGWSGYQSLGGTAASGPDASSWGTGRLDVFIVGTDGAVWHKWYDGRWHTWQSLGPPGPEPAPVSDAPPLDKQTPDFNQPPGAPPTGLAVTAVTPARATIRWNAVSGATGYQVARAPAPSGPYGAALNASPITATTLTDTMLAPNTTYYWKVWAHYSNARPGISEPVSGTTPAAVPPKNFKGTVNGSEVTFSWDAVGGAVGYWLSGDGLATQTGGTSYTARGVPPGSHNYILITIYRESPDAVQSEPARASVDVVGLPGGVATVEAPRIWGFADLHAHQFNNMGFGGLMLWGSPYGPMSQALQPCDQVHGSAGERDLFGSTLAVMSGAGGTGHPVGGHPDYKGWPRWNTFTHQQVYADWLQRAHDGGLQLMVMLAGNNPALCGVIDRAPGRSCDDMEAVRLAIQQAKIMESRIDNEHGGPGRGWYRLVYSPQQARQAIGKGQLAVVLGAEVPTLFGCRSGGPCTPQTVREDLRKLRELGLRQLNPIHNANNAFGGAAVYTDLFNISNKLISGGYFTVRDCAAEGVRFTFKIGAAVDYVNSLWEDILNLRYAPPNYSGEGHCNSLGLTALGDFFLRELMHQKMLIDVDHMSWRALDATLGIATQHSYPVVASHTGFLDISHGDKRSEGQKRLRDLQRIKALGGLVAPITFQGERAETVNPSSPIKHDCGNSSQSFAQAYLYAVHQLGFAPVALGSDFNGFAGQPSPRFGAEACNNGDKGNHPELNGRITYPIPVFGVQGRTLVPSIVGNKTFDYNVDGLAHIGMLPDLIQDLRQQGVRDQELEPLFRSAEAYIRLWEKIEASAVPAPVLQPTSKQMAVTAEPGGRVGGRATVVVTAVDAANGQPLSQGTVSISDAGGVLGELIEYTPCGEFDQELKEFVPGACTGRVMVSGYPDATFTDGN